MTQTPTQHLPLSMEECRQRGWDEVDVVLVTGDAYVDHPSFGTAIIARLLESRGFRVALLSQPRYHNSEDFKMFGRPRLFFGITAGNLDSIVANYSGQGKIRDLDAYSPDGNPWRSELQEKANRRRPDRATIIYAQLARAAYQGVPIILGGVEASLRRFIHYDYKQNKLRGSVLADGKGDLLLYGMAETAILGTAYAIQQGRDISNIKGSCLRLTENQFTEFRQSHSDPDITLLPSWHEIQDKPQLFLESEVLLDKHCRSASSKIIAQQQQSSYIVQFPSPKKLIPKELDTLYELPYTRKPHPSAGDIPAYRMIRHSVTIVRGCSGNCSFCAITRHQGPLITSRGKDSVVREVQQIAGMDDFSGTVSDLGGPTANLYGTRCGIKNCKKKDCLFPSVCKHLQTDEEKMLDLLNSVSDLAEVKHVFISSGLRMELLLKTPKLLEKIIASHTPGSIKIAPEHTENDILKLMHKESHSVLHRFLQECRRIGKRQGKTPLFTPYVITGHPGSTEQSAKNLVKKMKDLGLQVRQFQDFTPTPGTLSTAMFFSGLDQKKRPLTVPTVAQKKRQRAILERSFHKHRSLKKHQKAASHKRRGK